MKAIIELVYPDRKERKVVEFNFPARQMLNAVDNAVQKRFKKDEDWSRYNLLSIPSVSGKEIEEPVR